MVKHQPIKVIKCLLSKVRGLEGILAEIKNLCIRVDLEIMVLIETLQMKGEHARHNTSRYNMVHKTGVKW